MRSAVVFVSLSLIVVGCDVSGPGSGPDAGGPSVHVVSPPGFFHLPDPSMATTLYLQPDGTARLWMRECDSLGEMDGLTWKSLTSSTVELDAGTTTYRATFQDGGTLSVEPSLRPGRGVSPEIWSQGAVCSVCLPGWPIAVVGCPTPDAGVVGECCAGACNGGTPSRASCTFSPGALVTGTGAMAIPAGHCTCPARSVSAAECTGRDGVFCGGE